MVKKKILIFIISYKASFRLLDVYKKIPFKKLKKYNITVLFSDDASRDDTIIFARKIKQQNKNKKIIIRENKINLGYGGNIKKCLKFAYKNNFSYAVMIHGDNQYDPKYLALMVKELIKNKNIVATVGSRMINKSNALKGNMPMYKFIGNIFLTKLFNFLHNTKFTDCHTGYWGYNLKKINKKTFEDLDNHFCFDIDLRIKLVNRNLKIKEFAIKTYYGTERSSIHFIYAVRFFFKTIMNRLF